MEISIDGKSYAVVRQLREDRVIIDFDGMFVFADCMWGAWDLSGVPASLEEGKILQELCAPTNDKTVVTIIKDDE